MTEKLLLINDLSGYGKVALGAMMPILSRMGYDLYTLPTALVSNSLDHDAYEMLDTTDYLKRTLLVWESLGLSFDAIATGFVTSAPQASLITEFCTAQRKEGSLVFVDPIMGDQGKIYPRVDAKIVDIMRTLVATADVAIPNYTEACLLTGAPFSGAQGMTSSGVNRLMGCMRSICPRSVIVTSAVVDESPAVIGYDHERDESFVIPFEEIPVRLPGAGDVFAAVLMGKTLMGKTLEDATACAMHTVKDFIRAAQSTSETHSGTLVERYLEGMTR